MNKEETELIIKEQDKSTKEILKMIEQQKCELLGIIQGKDKVIKELEEKISVLLSCKNCPENKGGYICVKEYENKCLAQKMQYIKELQEENTEAKNLIEELASSLSVVGECGEEECELINKAQKFINKPIF